MIGYIPTGTPITRKNQLQILHISGAGDSIAAREAARKTAARNRKNYLDRRRNAAGKWAK